MGRVSTKENKTQYQMFREELGLSRERASELLGWISAERIEKIESEKSLPHPDEVLAMSVAYKKPRLCNHYCANVCPIGQEYVWAGFSCQGTHTKHFVICSCIYLNYTLLCHRKQFFNGKMIVIERYLSVRKEVYYGSSFDI